MNVNELQNWQRGDRFDAPHLDQTVRYLQSRGDLTAGPGMGVYAGGGAQIISNLTAQYRRRWFWGTVNGTGPQGDESDYTTQQYWIKAQYLAPTGDASAVPDLQSDTSAYGQRDDDDTKYVAVVTATNMAEQAEGTHHLQHGQVVLCWEEYETGEAAAGDEGSADAAAVNRWVFYCPDIGRGLYQYMVLQVTAQNQRGWDFTRAGSME